MMKLIVFALFLFFLFIPSSRAFCPHLPFLFTSVADVDLPCVDVDSQTCYQARLKWDENLKAFELVSVERTSLPLPPEPEKSFLPVYRAGVLKIPVAIVEANFETYGGELLLFSRNGKFYFRLEKAYRAVLPEVCRGENTVGHCLYSSNNQPFMCYEFQGSRLFVEHNLAKCANRPVLGESCPAGALDFCSKVLSLGEKIIFRAYQAEAVSIVKNICKTP